MPDRLSPNCQTCFGRCGFELGFFDHEALYASPAAAVDEFT